MPSLAQLAQILASKFSILRILWYLEVPVGVLVVAAVVVLVVS
jgi:hypothetical protein